MGARVSRLAVEAGVSDVSGCARWRANLACQVPCVICGQLADSQVMASPLSIPGCVTGS